jgi:hypothetical protein
MPLLRLPPHLRVRPQHHPIQWLNEIVHDTCRYLWIQRILYIVPGNLDSPLTICIVFKRGLGAENIAYSRAADITLETYWTSALSVDTVSILLAFNDRFGCYRALGISRAIKIRVHALLVPQHAGRAASLGRADRFALSLFPSHFSSSRIFSKCD